MWAVDRSPAVDKFICSTILQWYLIFISKLRIPLPRTSGERLSHLCPMNLNSELVSAE